MEIKNNKEFYDAIQKGVVLVDFYADWCGYCRKLMPIIDDLQKTWTKGRIIKINIDQMEDLAEQYEIEIIPTLIYFKNGKQMLKTLAEDTKENILNNLNSLLK